MNKFITLILITLCCLQLQAQKLTRFMLGTTVSGTTTHFESELINMGFQKLDEQNYLGKFKCSMGMAMFDTFDKWMVEKDYDIMVTPVSKGKILVAARMIVFSDTEDFSANKQMFKDICGKLDEDPFYEFKGTYDDFLGMVDRSCITFVQKDTEGKYNTDEFKLNRIVQVIPEEVGVVVNFINGWNLGMKQ